MLLSGTLVSPVCLSLLKQDQQNTSWALQISNLPEDGRITERKMHTYPSATGTRDASISADTQSPNVRLNSQISLSHFSLIAQNTLTNAQVHQAIHRVR